MVYLALSPKKGQANMEYLFLALLIIAFILPIVYFGLQSSYENYRLLQTGNVLHDLGHAADNVNSLGVGNRETITVTIPKGVTGALVKGNVFSIKSDTRKGKVPLTKEAGTNLVGSFVVNPGQHHIPLTTIAPNLVRVGEGVALFSATPSCAGTPQYPLTVTLSGDGITASTVLLNDGVAYPSSEVTYVNPTTLTFNALASEFSPKGGNAPYLLSLQENGEESNALSFYSHASNNFCGTFNALNNAYAETNPAHVLIEEITTQVASEDGYYHQLPPEQLLHLVFGTNLKLNDFLLVTYNCHEAGTISLLEEGSSTVVGSLSCPELTWETARLYISNPTTPSITFDIVSSAGVDIDSVSGWTT